MLRQKLYNFFQTHKVLNFTSLAEYLTTNGVVLDDEDTITGKFSLSFDIDPEEDLLGKTVSDLQENIKYNSINGELTGTLHYVTDFTDFSLDTEKQEGNYLAFRCDISDSSEIVIFEIGENTKESSYGTSENGTYIIRFSEPIEELFILAITNTDEIVGKYLPINISFEEAEENITEP